MAMRDRSNARLYTRNHADAEDLVQENLLKAFRAFDKLRSDPYLWGWLVFIMLTARMHRARSKFRDSLGTGPHGDPSCEQKL
jgi:DNA-directed RNA polymerase specialized sigma24 family protein